MPTNTSSLPGSTSKHRKSVEQKPIHSNDAADATLVDASFGSVAPVAPPIRSDVAENTIGRYEIRRELGRGAQGVVYLAWDSQLHREVALKTVQLNAADARMGKMLLSEARIMSQIRHDNVVPIFDMGEQNGDLYLVLEYVPGESLASLLKKQQIFEPKKAIHFIRQVLDALSQAHALSIVHRDLKPSNILIDINSARPRVMDFGIASYLDEANKITQRGLMGSAGYLAPEYIQHGTFDARVDVYAAGLILLEMIEGKKKLVAETVAQLLYQAINHDVEIPESIDPALGDIIRKACARDPIKRYPNASQMLLALDVYLANTRESHPAPLTTGAAPTNDEELVLSFLQHRMQVKGDFPALSNSVSVIMRLNPNSTEDLEGLAQVIQRDFALTNKMLRLVNSVYYRQLDGNVDTVARAILVLGLVGVRNVAMTVTVFDYIKDRSNVALLKEQFLQDNLTGLLAKDISKRFGVADAEEAFICGLFHNLGRMLVQFYFHEESEAIAELVETDSLDESAAAKKVLGITYHALGTAVAKSWGLPDAICESMRPLPARPIALPRHENERLALVASFSSELCKCILTGEDNRDAALDALSKRVSDHFKITPKQLRAHIASVTDQLSGVALALGVSKDTSNLLKLLADFRSRKHHQHAAPAPSKVDTPATGLQEQNRTSGLLVEWALEAGLERLKEAKAKQRPIIETFRFTLDAMHEAGAFDRMILCLKSPRDGRMEAKVEYVRQQIPRELGLFYLSSSSATDVFYLASTQGLDILVNDVNSPQWANKIPPWYRRKIDDHAFMLLPIVVNKVPVAMIYGGKTKAGSIDITNDRLHLFKALRDQLAEEFSQLANR